MDWLYDERTECWSVLTTFSVREYLTLVEKAHAKRGGISGQREVLKTTTAKRIRTRLVSDIRNGAILPPVVIGAVMNEIDFRQYPLKANESLSDFLGNFSPDDLSIIDGMQRTAALIDASKIDSNVLDRHVRVEFWLARSVRALVYRMLVLNTGQVPWTLGRQLSVVYSPLLKEIESHVNDIDRLFSPDKSGRRVAPGEYGGDALIELYLAFSLRKTAVDTKEALSEEFSRLDFVENVSDVAFQDQFYSTLTLLARFDKAFSRFEGGDGGRLSKGRNVFDGQPARIGFVVAVAQHVLGRAGLDRPVGERAARMDEISKGARELTERLTKMKPEAVGEFLKLDVLSEILDRRVGQVGRYERGVFFEAFKVMIDEGFAIPNMEPCWRAN